MRDMLAILINILIPAAVFLVWLIAEFRSRASIRITFAVLFMAIIYGQIWITSSTAELPVAIHRSCLYKIDLLLESGREEQVRRAPRRYRDTYEQSMMLP